MMVILRLQILSVQSLVTGHMTLVACWSEMVNLLMSQETFDYTLNLKGVK